LPDKALGGASKGANRADGASEPRKSREVRWAEESRTDARGVHLIAFQEGRKRQPDGEALPADTHCLQKARVKQLLLHIRLHV